MSKSSKKGIGAMGSWLHKKIVDPFIKIIRRGAEPKQLAFSTALGISLGVFPIVGVTVFLCGLAIALLGPYVNAPTVMLANFVATPLELSLMVVFLRFGEFVTGGPHFPLTADALKKVFTGEASTEIFGSILHALLGWLVLAPLILGALYIILLPCFIILVHKLSNASNPKLTTPSSTDLRLKVRDN
ncbi:hypothetical protein CTI12_AA129330 [Artemisia annua]|uniref:DUF2062 domain-containing protein n=1 Tax=Artemisia annua TaxID=35608 RepID=A0A2U1PP61_ARTAN|nr:hypothetical protein CTI12_AA129330 [Artemisia annua]